MKTRILATVAATLVGLVALGALTPSTAAAQTACYVPGSGTMYRIKEANTPAKCSAGHVEFQLTAAAKPGGSGGGSTGAAGGDLGGSYPNPSVVKIQGQPISTNVPAAGQVLTFSGGSWTPVAPNAAALPTNAAGAYDFSNINGLVAVGTPNTGVIPASGAGQRFEFVARYGAIRAGTVDGTQWDEGVLGNSSAAFGRNTTASGTGTLATGGDTKASGVYAVATGSLTTASGSYAHASGLSSVASGQASTAMGSSTSAIGSESSAFGFHTTASGAGSTAMGNYANTSGMAGTFVYGDASTTNVVGAPLDNSFIVRAQHFWFGTTSSPAAASGHLIETSTGAYLSTGGTWTNTSDVNKKHAFMTIDSDDVLARVESMPVSTWTYNTEADSVRHMGPTAQDFRKAFGLGDTEKAIATVDADGVSLAAIKALIQRTTQLRKENDDLKAMLADLAQRLSQLEQARR